MEVVGAGFRGDQHGGSGACAVLGGVVVGQNFEFLNVIDRGKSADTSGCQFVVVYAIQDPVGAVRARAADREREGAARGHFTAGGGREKAIGVRLRRCAGGESGELDEVAAVQRKLRDLFRVDDLAEGGIGGFYRYGGSGHFYRRGNRGRCERKVQFARFFDLQAQILVLDGLKTLKL